MICKISDLLVEIPAAGGMAPRCGAYLAEGNENADIVIREDLYDLTKYQGMSDEIKIYLQSGLQFYRELLRFDGLMLHASAVALDGKAYLFSGPCGVGKSTHTKLWQSVFGKDVVVFNDDKPALRRLDGRWYAYGTPWCGKDGINVNMKVPLAGICFLKQSDRNEIKRIDGKQALARVISQTTYHLRDVYKMLQMMTNVEKLIAEIPIYEFCNRPETAAAEMSHKIMSENSQEVVL